MATGKKSFVLYTDLIHTISLLSDEDAGKVFKHLLEYVNDEDPAPLPGLLAAVWEPHKQQLKRDLKKYESIIEKRSKAGKISAEKRAQQKSTSVKSVEQSPTDSTDSDNVTVNDTDTVNENDKEKKESIISTSVETAYNFLIDLFPEKFRPKNDKAVGEWKRDIKRLHTLDGYTFKEICQVIKRVRLDEFWEDQFLSLLKCRKLNKDKIKFFDYWYQQMQAGKLERSGPSLYTYNEVISKKEYEGRWFKVFRPIEMDGPEKLWAHIEDIKKFNLIEKIKNDE